MRKAPTPTREQLLAAEDKTVPDVIAPGPARSCSAASTPACTRRRSATTSPGPATASGRRCTRRASPPRLLAPVRGAASCWRSASASPTWSRGPPPRRTSCPREELRAGGGALRGEGAALRAAVPGGAGRRRVPRRLRPAQGRARAAARAIGGTRAVGAAQPERAQRALPASGSARLFERCATRSRQAKRCAPGLKAMAEGEADASSHVESRGRHGGGAGRAVAVWLCDDGAALGRLQPEMNALPLAPGGVWLLVRESQWPRWRWRSRRAATGWTSNSTARRCR